jgi:hypothetical protein
MNAKGVAVLVGLAVLAGLLAWFAAFRGGGGRAVVAEESDAGARLLPALVERSGEIARIEIEQSGSSVAIAKSGGGWAIESVGGYPADGERVRQLVTTLSELRTEEPKTAKPEYYDRLAVQWPDTAPQDAEAEPGAIRPTLVRLLDGAGGAIAEVVLGETTFDVGKTRQYARALSDAQSWLVSARVDAPTGAMRWLNARFIELPRESIRRVTITQATGESVAVSRDDPSGDFGVENIPEGMAAISEGLANRIGAALAFVNFTDVRRADGETGGEAAVAVFETFEGLTLRLETRPDPEGGWVVARAEGTGAEAYAPRFDGWAFRLPATTVESLTRRPSDLLEEIAPAQGPAPGDEVPELLRAPEDG